MLTCKKCGLELHEDQKVCIGCGTRTLRGDGFDYDQKRWKPTRNMKIGAGIVGFLLLIALVANCLRVTPPDVVAKEWFTAMAEREISKAGKYVTPTLKTSLESRGMDLRAVSDEYYTEVTGQQAKYSLAPPVLKGGNSATIQIALNYPGGGARQLTIGLTKQGRRWLVNEIE